MHVQPHIPDVIEDLCIPVHAGMLQGTLGVHVELDAVVLLLTQGEGHLQPFSGLSGPAKSSVHAQQAGVVLPAQLSGAHVLEASPRAHEGLEALLKAVRQEQAPTMQLVSTPLPLKIEGLHPSSHQPFTHVPTSLVRWVQKTICLSEFQEGLWVFFICPDLVLGRHDCALELPLGDILRTIIAPLRNPVLFKLLDCIGLQ
mmetsp:Transcript_113023/g.314553  ORF Transcript_113023/g.314553 Transcript_113023/m.314553 type:complete len:200 (-) Transcript_113023:19-618(-)